MKRMRLGLTAEQIEARRAGIGGSDATVLMNGDADAIMALYLEKIGEAPPTDLSDVLPAQIGVCTEPLNCDWYERQTGRTITCEGEPRVSVTLPFMRCTLDGITTTAAGDPAIFQAKHVNAFANIEDVSQKYMAQVHHEMAVTGLGWAVLSVFIGTLKWECVEIEMDDWYLAQVIDRERAFWRCVETRTPPGGMEPVASPEAPKTFRVVDMTGNNAWSQHAADWLANKAAADTFDGAVKEIKALMLPNIGEAHGYGVTAKRDKKGAIRVHATKEPRKGRRAA